MESYKSIARYAYVLAAVEGILAIQILTSCYCIKSTVR